MSIDYNAKLAQDYEEIKRKVVSGLLPIEARVKAVEQATNAYITAQDADFERKRAKQEESGGVVPIQLRNDTLLHRLSDLLMYEYLTWSHPDKMSIVEYPIMSGWQEEVREKKQIKTRDGEITYEGRQANGRRKSYYFGDDGEVGVSNSKMPDIYNEDIEGAVENMDVLDLLDSAGLTERQREAIELVYFDGLSQVEAAEALGVTRHTVNEHLSISLRKLRKTFGKSPNK